MNYRNTVGLRVLFLTVLFGILFALLLTRIFWLQTVEASWLKEKAAAVWSQKVSITAERGKIFDRNGEALAYDAPAYTVVATLSPKAEDHVTDPRATAAALAEVLQVSEEKLYQQLTRDAYQVELRQGGWKISADVAEKVMALNLPGISLMEETKRFYPNDRLASHLLGYVDLEGNAKMGIELSLDEVLSGTPGSKRYLRDGAGVQLPDGELERIPPQDGLDVYLTIDRNIQSFVERALSKAEKELQPKRMVAIVTHPRTGEILAMANRPDFNPNQYWNIQNYSNYAVSYPFEPGSTFKIITLAAAIEEGVFREEETYQSGTIYVPGSSIPVRDYNNGRGWGEITFLQGVQRSSNVLFTKLGVERLGQEKLLGYIEKFGFRSKTGVELLGEAQGRVPAPNDKISIRDVASITFGQAVAVTPIQQVAAIGAIANGGVWVPPTVVKKVVDANGQVVQERQVPEGVRVISEETAQKVSRILEKVVEFGGAEVAYLEGYRVAGKTGTAQKFDPQTGELIKGENIASFIGYAPAHDPQIVVYVAVDAPRLNYPYYGSTVAAPIVQEIMRNTLHYLRVPMEK